MKTIIDFMQELKDEKYEVDYPDGYVIVFNSNGKMYAECENKDKDIKVTFAFEDADDLLTKCDEILSFEIRFCDYCGCPFNCGYTDDDADFYNCEECFPKDMDERYGKGNWRTYESENGDCNWQGGYYERLVDGKWEAEPSYYTEWY